jgi:hypothetical protein
MADNINDLLKQARDIKSHLDSLFKEAGAGTDAIKRAAVKATQPYKELVSQLKEVNSQVQDLKGNTRDYVDSLVSQQKTAKELTGIYSTLGQLDLKRVEKQAGALKMDEAKVKQFERLSDLNQKLAALSFEDSISRGLIEKEIQSELADLEGSRGIHSHIVKNLKQQYSVASNLSKMTAKQKEFLEDQIDAYDKIQKTIGGILETAKLLTSTVGGVLGAGLIGAGYAAEALGKSVREMGGYMGAATFQVTALGTIFPSAVESAKGLSREFGGLKDVSMQTQLNTNLMATNMGISGDEAASLTGNFARLNGGSAAVAEDMAESTKQLALQNGLVPSDVMKDVAGSSKAFAEFGKKGGKNIAEAAVAAGKLGVNMNALTTVTDRLLDFESSINDELELGAMLGKNLNLNNARSLAYNGQIGDAVKETLNQLGGIDAFNKMDVFQKRKAAQLLGLSVEEFQKMATNSDKLNADGTMQLTTFESWSQSLSAFASGPLGSALKGVGSMVIAAGQFNSGLGVMGTSIGGLVKGTGQVLSNLLQMVAGPVINGMKAIGSSLANSGVGKAVGGIKDKLLAGVGGGVKPDVPKGPDLSQKGGLMDSMKSIDMNAVLKGAAAMLIVAAAVFVFGKAVQEFMKVSWTAVGMAVVSMLALVGAVALLGAIMSSGVGAIAILAGAAAMLIVAASVLVLGIALQAIGTGFQMLSNGLTTLTPNITAIGGVLMGLVETIPAIVLLSGALFGLAAALTAVGIAGIIAAPGLMALATVNAIAGGITSILGGGDSGKDSHMDDLIAEVKGLRDDLNAGKVAVYLDGVKVTAGVSRTVATQGTNHYGHK